MKILLCVKQILDTRVSFNTERGDGNLGQLEAQPVFSINPADRCALELARTLKDQEPGTEIVAVTVAPERAEEALFYCLAVGVDRSIRIHLPEGILLDAFMVARELASVAREIEPDLILCGTVAFDENSGIVGPALAELIDVPQVTGVVRVELRGRCVEVHRRLERGAREAVETSMPCLLAVEPTLNEPSYVSQRRLWHARRLPIQVRDLSLAEVVPQACLNLTVAITPPRPRPKWVPPIDTNLSPADRLKALMMGGAKAKKKSDDFVEGHVEEIIDRIVKYLEREGVLNSRS